MTTPTRARRRRLALLIAAPVGVVLLVLCGAVGYFAVTAPPEPAGSSRGVIAASTAGSATQAAPTIAPSSPARSTAPRATATRSTTTPATDPPTRRLCRFDDDPGSYYVLVTSATAHDFSLCNGATTVPGTIDDLLTQPGMDRRCVITTDTAIAGVYSDTRAGNLAAARGFCTDAG